MIEVIEGESPCSTRRRGEAAPDGAHRFRSVDSARCRVPHAGRTSDRHPRQGVSIAGPSRRHLQKGALQRLGKCLLVDVEYLGPATPEEVLQEAPTARPADLVLASVSQDEISGVNAVFGIWPGDETDEEFLAARRTT